LLQAVAAIQRRPVRAHRPRSQKKARDKPGVEAGKASEGGSGS